MANLSEIKKDSNWGEAASTINSNFQNMNVDLEKVKSSTTKFKGYFTTETALKEAYPSPKVGETAWVGSTYPGTVYDVQVAGTWHNTGTAPDTEVVDLTEYARKEELTELSKKIGLSVTESYDKYPNGKWCFIGKLNNRDKGLIRVKTNADISSCSIHDGVTSLKKSITKNWEFIDLTGCENFQVYTVLSRAEDLTLQFIKESELFTYLDELKLNIETFNDLKNSVGKIEDSVTSIEKITEPTSWAYKTSYTFKRPFSFSILDVLKSGVDVNDINVLFNSENRIIDSIVIEYASTNKGNKTYFSAPELLETDGNKYYYKYNIPELSILQIDGDLTKFIVTCQISGEATEELPHVVNLTEASYKVYLKDTVEKIDSRVTVLENASGEEVNNVVNYNWRGYNNMKHIVVKKDGSGDFTTIQDAINSITDASPSNQYDVQVWDDFYITNLKDLYKEDGSKNTEDNPTTKVMLFKMKNWVHVRGMGRRRFLSVVSPENLEGKSFQHVQVIFPEGNNILSNFYVSIKGGRYAIHQESGGSKTSQDYHSTTIFRDIIAEHFGNSSYRNGSSWTSCYAQANGTTSGTNWIYERCIWISHEENPFYTHANMDFDEPCRLTFINCEMLTYKKTTAASVSKGCYFGDLGSNVKSIVKMIGCNLPGFSASSIGNIRGLENTYQQEKDDIRQGGCELKGYGNTVMLSNIYADGAFRFETINNGSNIEIIGGTAYEGIWGETYRTIKGGTLNKGQAISIHKIYDRNSQWGTGATALYSLAYRLGNCSDSPKTLTVKVDEEEYTINFNENYMTEDGNDYSYNTVPRFTNQEICDKINAQYSEKFKAYPNGVNKMESFDDCKISILNRTGDTIPFGRLLVRDSENGYNAYKLATSDDYDKVIAISADYINEGEVGNAILIKKSLFNYLYFTSKGVGIGQLYTVGSNGAISLTSDKERAVFENIDGETLKYIR